jgi:hypothetical protein
MKSRVGSPGTGSLTANDAEVEDEFTRRCWIAQPHVAGEPFWPRRQKELMRPPPPIFSGAWRAVASSWTCAACVKGIGRTTPSRPANAFKQFFSSTPLPRAPQLQASRPPNYRAQYKKKNTDLLYYTLRSASSPAYPHSSPLTAPQQTVSELLPSPSPTLPSRCIAQSVSAPDMEGRRSPTRRGSRPTS